MSSTFNVRRGDFAGHYFIFTEEQAELFRDQLEKSVTTNEAKELTLQCLETYPTQEEVYERVRQLQEQDSPVAVMFYNDPENPIDPVVPVTPVNFIPTPEEEP